jgi:hypothetical protein
MTDQHLRVTIDIPMKDTDVIERRGGAIYFRFSPERYAELGDTVAEIGGKLKEGITGRTGSFGSYRWDLDVMNHG